MIEEGMNIVLDAVAACACMNVCVLMESSIILSTTS